MFSSVSGWFRVFPALLGLLLLATVLFAGTASANGAVRLVVIDEVAGPYLLRVGVLPGDPTIGPLHVSTLIQDAIGDIAVDDATVLVSIAGPGSPERAQAVNSPQGPQLYEANLLLDALGQWSITLEIDSSLGPASHTFIVRASDEGGFNIMFIIVAIAAALVVGTLVRSQLQRRRRLSRER